MTPLLSVGVSVRYGSSKPVLDDLEFDLYPGEILGIVGRSGCGKSTLSMTLLRLLDPNATITSGHVTFAGADLLRLPEKSLRRVRGKEIALVLQAAASALNPYMTIEAQFREAWRAHNSQPWSDRRTQVLQTCSKLNLEPAEELLLRYPGQISVGQAQRVLIAMALLHNPSLLILDEPTSALDFLARSEVLQLIRAMKQTSGLSILYISHDLQSIQALCDRVAILHDGKIVETGEPKTVFSSPQHPVTRLFAAALQAEELQTV